MKNMRKILTGIIVIVVLSFALTGCFKTGAVSRWYTYEIKSQEPEDTRLNLVMTANRDTELLEVNVSLFLGDGSILIEIVPEETDCLVLSWKKDSGDSWTMEFENVRKGDQFRIAIMAEQVSMMELKFTIDGNAAVIKSA